MSLTKWEKEKEGKIKNSSDPDTIFITAAIKSGKKFKIRYTKPGGVDVRMITAKKIFSKQGEMYLEAFCHKRNARRVFMIRRITLLTDVTSEAETKKVRVSNTQSNEVTCSISYFEAEGDYGPVNSVEARCSRCGHATESFGDGADSVRRCLALMREECPNNESNFYVEE